MLIMLMMLMVVMMMKKMMIVVLFGKDNALIQPGSNWRSHASVTQLPRSTLSTGKAWPSRDRCRSLHAVRHLQASPSEPLLPTS